MRDDHRARHIDRDPCQQSDSRCVQHAPADFSGPSTPYFRQSIL